MTDDLRADLFNQARRAFADKGLLGRALRLLDNGCLYSARCDAALFTVYRVNDKPFLPPGLPGWMVCRLGPAECFSLAGPQAACPPAQDDQDLDQARQWVALVLERLAQDAYTL